MGYGSLFLMGIKVSVALILLPGSCKTEEKKDEVPINIISTDYKIKHAQGFDIEYFEDYKKLTISSPFPGSEESHVYYLVKGDRHRVSGTDTLSIPLKRLIATSTTHIPMLEALGSERALVGFPNTDFITSAKTRDLVEKELLQDIGKDLSLNPEMVIGLQPDALIAFALDASDKAYTTVRKNGVPIVFNGDWLEESPLGRAEWIKFFGALLDLDHEADSIFTAIEREYLGAREMAMEATSKPTVMSGVLFKDQWNLPAGESFTAQLYKDANTEYIWKDSKGQGSLVLNFETVLEKAGTADYWIGSGVYTTREDLLNANGHYAQFEAFKTNSVYTFSKLKGARGGVVYFELGPMQPHIVLKDLIKVTHPELLPGYQPYFLKPLD